MVLVQKIQPSQILAVFENLKADQPKDAYIGIVDDVYNTRLKENIDTSAKGTIS